MNQQPLSALIWSVADLLRGDYRQSEYGRVILPFTILRRLDCVLAPTKEAVLAEHRAKVAADIPFEAFVQRKSGQTFYNISTLDMPKLMGDQDNLRANLHSYIQGFSADVRDIFERFDFATQVERLHKAGLLYLVTEKFANIDLSPEHVEARQMGLVFEELIRRFAELSNETAGEHFTPRDVIQLMVELLLGEDETALNKPGSVRTIYDPTAGTGGMLSLADDFVSGYKMRLVMYGQELNDESYAICKADMLIKGQDVSNITPGNTLSEDGHPGKKFDYMLSNPPFGVEWKKVEKEVRKEFEQQGHAGRFGPGLPRISDGSLLFLMHLLSKMQPEAHGGSRIGIVLNGSPLFTGGAGSGESEIRRHVLENDLVEAIVALPTDMFYNTGIATYVWILTNRKPEHRKGFVQLIDGSAFWRKTRKSLGSKRKELSADDISHITRLFGAAAEASYSVVLNDAGKETGRTIMATDDAQAEGLTGTMKVLPVSKIFRNHDFGYRTITVERPLRDEGGKIVLGERGKQKGKPLPDASLRDTENVPLSEDVETYFKREVLPYAPDAWIDHEKTKIGYEIPFNRHFYVFEPPRPLGEIDADLKACTDRIKVMIEGLAA
jgi:type I restriction enzyme M protein